MWVSGELFGWIVVMRTQSVTETHYAFDDRASVMWLV